MKNIKKLVVAGVLGLGICALAIAQGHLRGAQGHGLRGHLTGDAVEYLAEAFPNFAAFDANEDGQFDAAEMESVGRAMADGRLHLPAHMPPSGVEPGGEAMLAHIGEMYARFARYDANHDGALDATEQSAIKTAIEKGELTCPMGGSRPHH